MSNKRYLIGEAVEDESMSSTNGLPGDQVGYELRARDWYAAEPIWAKVYRFEDQEVAEEIASRAEKTILNGYVGYDKNHRNTFLDQLKEVNFDVNVVHTNCSVDNSSFIYAALYGTTGVKYNPYPIDKYKNILSIVDDSAGSKGYYDVFDSSNIENPNELEAPEIAQFDYYIERQLAEKYKITVFTINETIDQTTYDSLDIDNKKEYVGIEFPNEDWKYFHYPFYTSPWDFYNPSVDELTTSNNLSVIYLNEPNTAGPGGTQLGIDFLNTFLTYRLNEYSYLDSVLQRGDIIKTLSTLKNKEGTVGSGHAAIWL